MKFHKAVMDRLIFANVDYLEKGWTPPKGPHSTSFQFPHSNTTTTNFIDDKKKATWKDYKYDKDKGEMRVREHWPKEEKGKKQRQYKTTKIPASASHEEELKNASLHATLDEILEKARPRASERKDPNRRKAEGPDDNLIIPDTKHVQTMSNPGPTEAEHYERTKGGSKENLKRLAESKSAMDRKAAERGLKRHE